MNSISKLESMIDATISKNILTKTSTIDAYELLSHLCGVISFDSKNEIANLTSFFGIFLNNSDKKANYKNSQFLFSEKINPSVKQHMACSSLSVIYPDIHKKRYLVDEIQPNKFHIKFPSDEHKYFEKLDIALCRDSLPVNIIYTGKDALKHIESIKEICKEGIFPLNSGKSKLINHFYCLAIKSFSEEFPIDEKEYKLLGFNSIDSYIKIRAFFISIFHITHLCYKLLIDEINKSNDNLDIAILDFRLKDKINLIKLNSQELISTVVDFTLCDDSEIKKFLSHYSIDLDSNDEESIEFNENPLPIALRKNETYYLSGSIGIYMLSSRNMIYRLQRSKKKEDIDLFNNFISANFEPNLINKIINLFKCKNFEINTEIRYNESGDFDLVILCKKSNSILLSQAKATLPPDTSRALSRLEGRIIEGIDQIIRFKKSKELDKINFLKSIHPELNTSTKIYHSVISSSCFGSKSAWDKLKLNEIIALNYYILNKYTNQYSDFEHFECRVNKITNEIFSEFDFQEEVKEFNIDGIEITQESIIPTPKTTKENDLVKIGSRTFKVNKE